MARGKSNDSDKQAFWIILANDDSYDDSVAPPLPSRATQENSESSRGFMSPCYFKGGDAYYDSETCTYYCKNGNKILIDCNTNF